MRVDSCRKCGDRLEINKKCTICSSAIKFCCKKCNFESEEQIHSLCRLVDMNNIAATS